MRSKEATAAQRSSGSVHGTPSHYRRSPTRLIDCDAEDHPPTAGYVPRSTLLYATACVDLVPMWVRCARVVSGDPQADVATRLPAALPPWRYDEPTTTGELRGLRAAYEALQPRVEMGLQAATVEAARLGRMRRLLAEMTSSAEYAAAMMRVDLGPVDRGEVRARLLGALRRAFELGQVLALPTLTDVMQAHEDEEDEPSIARRLSWVDVDTKFVVTDSGGRRVGFVQRVLGDRSTGEFWGIEVNLGPGRPDLAIPPGVVETIRPGEVVLSVHHDELGPRG